jgi:hypothetical protein
MEFGLLKSKIENILVESYNNGTFNNEIKNFKSLVLGNKEVRMSYHLYEELSKEKGFIKEFAEDYLDECISLYSQNTINKTTLKKLNEWVKNVKCENNYSDIDTVLSKNTFIIENIIKEKQNIVKRLTSKKVEVEQVNLPLEKMVEVANNTLSNYLTTLNEEDLATIKKYSTLSKDELSKRYEVLSEMVIEKLEKLTKTSEKEVVSHINETISKIKNDKIDSVSLIKLKTLNESL